MSKIFKIFSYIYFLAAIAGMLLILSALTSGSSTMSGFGEAILLLFVIGPIMVVSGLILIIHFLIVKSTRKVTTGEKSVVVIVIGVGILAIALWLYAEIFSGIKEQRCVQQCPQNEGYNECVAQCFND